MCLSVLLNPSLSTLSHTNTLLALDGYPPSDCWKMKHGSFPVFLFYGGKHASCLFCISNTESENREFQLNMLSHLVSGIQGVQEDFMTNSCNINTQLENSFKWPLSVRLTALFPIDSSQREVTWAFNVSVSLELKVSTQLDPGLSCSPSMPCFPLTVVQPTLPPGGHAEWNASHVGGRAPLNQSRQHSSALLWI